MEVIETLAQEPSEAIEALEADPQAIWQSVRDALKESLSRPSFRTFIQPMRLEWMMAGQVKLSTESDFHRTTILKNYRQEILDAFKNVLGIIPDLEIGVHERTEADENALQTRLFDDTPPQDTTDASSGDAKPGNPLPARPWTPRATRSNLNPKYTFEYFVVGTNNRFAHAAALAIAETPARSYNPFFVYGGVGLGKSHLVQAIGHFVQAHHPDLLVKYVTAEQFTNELIASLGGKDMKVFRDRYRRCDVLIIDDIQFLEGKERTQEEVFHTFNDLHAAGKQIILTSDRSPQALSRLEDRLRSRFEWGLITDIQAPDLETRIAILQRKALREHQLDLPMPVLTYIAEMHPNNIRELEGALTKVAAHNLLTRSEITLENVQALMGRRVDPTRLSLDHIVEAVARYYHMMPSDIKSPSRSKDVSHARQVAIYIIRDLTEASFPKIGELLGGRKHTTILYAFEKMREELQHQPLLARQVQEITQRLKAGMP